MTEFAIVLPIFLLLLLGIAQLGVTFHNYVQLTDGARAAARYGVTMQCSGGGSCDRAGTVSAKLKESAANLDPAKVNVEVASSWVAGSDLKVCGSYPYSISLIGLVVKSGNLSSCTTERLE
jgi:Flp pilus assembly protein TadG